MGQRGVLLSGIARVLNAGGSALLNVYDAATSIKTIVLPGEKGNLSAQLREYEKKIEKLYREIGKEVVLREDSAGLSAAGEAGIKLAAGYQAEIEKIRQRIQNIEAESKAAAAKKEAAPEHTAARVKMSPEPPSQPIADAEESVEAELPELTEGAVGSTEPEAASLAVEEEPEEVAAPVVLEALLKSDLLQMCSEKGIEADKRMTKAEIIELISGR